MRRTGQKTRSRSWCAVLAGSLVTGLLAVAFMSASPGPGMVADSGRLIGSTTFDVVAGQGGAEPTEVVSTASIPQAHARWSPGTGAAFRVNEAGAPDGAVEAVVAAASSWQRAGIDVRYEYVGVTAIREASADLVNVVSWIETPDDRDVFVARTTTYWYIDQPDVIIGFDLTFNLDYEFGVVPNDGAWDLETVALHELGHGLGLGHSDPERVLQTMRPRIEAGEIDRTLSLRDVDAVISLYGAESAHSERGFFSAGSFGIESRADRGADAEPDPLSGVDRVDGVQLPNSGLFP